MQSAGAEFQKALELDPKQASQAFNQHFGGLLQQGRFEEALNLGKFIIKYSPKNYVIYNHMGNCARRLKLRDTADEYYLQACKLKPDYQKPYLNIGANRAKVELYDLKIEAFLNEWVPTRELILPNYQGDKNLISQLTEQIEEEDGEGEATAARIKELLTDRMKNRWKSADPDFVQQIIQQDQYNAALYALHTEDFPRAIELLSRLVDQKSTMPEAATLLCLAKNSLDNSEENLEAFFDLQEASPYDRVLNLNLGICCFNNGQIAHGYHYLCRTADLLSRSEGLYRLSEIIVAARNHADKGDAEAAIGLYKEAFLVVERIEFVAEIAKLYQALDQHDLALESFLQLKELAPEHELTQATLQDVHDTYLKKAEDQLDEQQFTTALQTNARAEKLLIQISTLTQKSRILRVLNRLGEAEQLDEKVAVMKVAEEKAKFEAQRQALIQAGKKVFRAKDYLRATKILDQALSMKKDKDVFLLIAGIYKNLKHTRALNDLLYRWKAMPDPVEEEEEIQDDVSAGELNEEALDSAERDGEEQAEPQEPSMMDEIASRPQFDMDF